MRALWFVSQKEWALISQASNMSTQPISDVPSTIHDAFRDRYIRQQTSTSKHSKFMAGPPCVPACIFPIAQPLLSLIRAKIMLMLHHPGECLWLGTAIVRVFSLLLPHFTEAHQHSCSRWMFPVLGSPTHKPCCNRSIATGTTALNCPAAHV